MTQQDKSRAEFEAIFSKYFPRKSVHRKACEAIWQAARANSPQANDADVVEVMSEAIWETGEEIKPSDANAKTRAALTALQSAGYRITKIGE